MMKKKTPSSNSQSGTNLKADSLQANFLTESVWESTKLRELLQPPALTPGTLYVVATPIGNLRDLTFRALGVLQACDLVLAEDTRRTGLLLHLFGIRKPLLSCHKFNEARRLEPVLQELRAGRTVALVSDAGTPGISDPGQRIVQAAVANGIRVEPIPGASAAITALMASGLPTDEFHFVGFLPKKPHSLQERLQELLTLPGTLVFYESPYRIERLLKLIAELAPQRRLVVARELTKKFEQFLRGTAQEILQTQKGRKWKGEIVVLIGPVEQGREKGPSPTQATDSASSLVSESDQEQTEG